MKPIALARKVCLAQSHSDKARRQKDLLELPSDGRQNVNGKTTYYTLLVYLNDDCIGGSTKFRQGNLVVHPKAGNAILFQHHLWHQGTKVEEGAKYVLRTDVVYE